MLAVLAGATLAFAVLVAGAVLTVATVDVVWNSPKRLATTVLVNTWPTAWETLFEKLVAGAATVERVDEAADAGAADASSVEALKAAVGAVEAIDTVGVVSPIAVAVTGFGPASPVGVAATVVGVTATDVGVVVVVTTGVVPILPVLVAATVTPEVPPVDVSTAAATTFTAKSVVPAQGIREGHD